MTSSDPDNNRDSSIAPVVDRNDSTPAKNKRRNRSLRSLGLIVGIIVAVYAYTHAVDHREPDATAKQGKPALSVVAESAAQGDFPIYLSGLGSVVPLHTITVRSRVDGEVIRVAYTEGQMVRQGDLLAEIDPRPFQVQLQQAEGQLARDEALLENAQIDLARYKTLLAQDSIAAQQTVTQESLVKQYRGIVETDRAQVANAKLQLAYAHITAPVAGRVGLRLVDPGNIVHATDTGGLVVITQIQPIAVVFTLPEDDLPSVLKHWRRGEAIPVDAYDRAGKTKLATGSLLAVDNQIDTTTGTIKLKARFANDDQMLFANQFVNVRMRVDTLIGVTIVPSAAIQQGTPGSFVYAVKEDRTVSVRPVKLGPAQGERTAILDGLAPGELIVVDGADKLREGAKVELIHRGSPKVPGKAEHGPAPNPARGKGP